MALVESWLQSRLANFAAIATAADTAVKVYPVFAPQSATEPFVTFRKTGTRRDYNTRRNDGKPTATFDINCWDTNYSRLKSYAEQVRIALDGYQLRSDDHEIRRCSIVDEQDIEDPSDWGFEQPTYGVQFVIEIVHVETVATYT